MAAASAPPAPHAALSLFLFEHATAMTAQTSGSRWRVLVIVSGPEILDSLLHGLGLGLEISEIRLKFGDHLGLAPVAAAEPAVFTITAAPT